MANPLYDKLIGEHATNDACFLRQPGKPANIVMNLDPGWTASLARHAIFSRRI